jgi:hypothetical protein
MKSFRYNANWLLYFAIIVAGQNAFSQTNLAIYTGHLVNGFQDWSWASVNLFNNSPVYTNSHSISVTDGQNYQALYLEHPQFDTSLYGNLDFWINGGSSGGQKLQVTAVLDGTNQAYFSLGTLQTNVWQHFSIPLSSLGVAHATNCNGFWIQGAIFNSQPTFYVDQIQLLAASPPAMVHLGVDASSVIRNVDSRWFGLNTATWDGQLGNSQTLPLLKQIGCTALRWPGGSTSDQYHWASDTSGNQTFMTLVTNLAAQSNSFITVNYGTGTSNEAAAWVRSVNITNHCGVKYWEIGNENYGATWEADSNPLPHDPYTYAVRAAGYIQLMKAADPTIKIGAVVVPGEDNYTNYLANLVTNPATGEVHSGFVTNPVTGQAHAGWTPVMLATFKNLGVYPDFLIYHSYPEYTSSGSNSTDSDPLLLQVSDDYSRFTYKDWGSAAVSLRQQLSDYLGGPGTNIELCVTENNSDAGAQGKQSTSVVNALYLADSMGQLMKTEFNSLFWWDFRNGPLTTGDFDPTLYGWRTSGDLGMIQGTSTPYPTFYAAKLMQSLVRPGDTVLNATSDYLALSAYASRRSDGALALLVINKTPTNILNAQIAFTNFAPWATATVRSYGIPQDVAVQTNGPAAARDIYTNVIPAAASFTNTFLPYSLTLLTFEPGAPSLTVPISILPDLSEFAFQLEGNAGVPYVIQSSTDMMTWTSVSTNFASGPSMWVTNSIPPGTPTQFWRAVWQP